VTGWDAVVAYIAAQAIVQLARIAKEHAKGKRADAKANGGGK